MSPRGKINDFEVSSELELDLGDGWRWYRLMRRWPDGGWVREILEDGRLDNSRDGIRVVDGSLVVRTARAVPLKRKQKRSKQKGDPAHN